MNGEESYARMMLAFFSLFLHKKSEIFPSRLPHAASVWCINNTDSGTRKCPCAAYMHIFMCVCGICTRVIERPTTLRSVHHKLCLNEHRLLPS